MKNKEDFAVIGCGRFGTQVALTLSQMGKNVIAVDEDEETINALTQEVTYAVVADVTQENVLAEIGVGNCQAAVIAIGEHFEAALMATLACRDLGIPRIIGKVKNESMGRVLMKVGASQIVIPERDQGIKLAHALASHQMSELIGLSNNHAILELECPKAWLGKSLKDLEIRSQYGVSIIGVGRQDQAILYPQWDDVFQPEDRIMALGRNEDLARLEKHISQL